MEELREEMSDELEKTRNLKKEKEVDKYFKSMIDKTLNQRLK